VEKVDAAVEVAVEAAIKAVILKGVPEVKVGPLLQME
jgi:hypothetical protein